MSGLEESIIQEGRALDPLKVWTGILIDGHNRYEICTRHSLPFETQDIGSPDWIRSTAIIWIIKNQFARRNLTSLDRISLALRLEQEFEVLARKNQRVGAAIGNSSKVVTQPLLQTLAKAERQQPQQDAHNITDDCQSSSELDTNEPEPVKWWDKPVIVPVNTSASPFSSRYRGELASGVAGSVIRGVAFQPGKAGIR